MNTNLTRMTFAANLAAISMARGQLADNCCRVYAGENFTSLEMDYCLEVDERQSAFDIDL